MNNSTQNILGGIAMVVALSTFFFASKANQAAENSKTACYQTVNNASGVSDQYKLKMIKACNQ
jgi:hypothetical protein